MDDNTDFDRLLLENFELILSEVARGGNSVRTGLYMRYTVLKPDQFQRWIWIEDVEEAIKKGRHAVAETREQDGAYAGWLTNLGNMLESRYEPTEKMDDLEEAIRAVFGVSSFSVLPWYEHQASLLRV